MVLNQKQSVPTLDVNRRMDEDIERMEKSGDIYIGVQFTPEEKRVLVPIIGNKMKILKFYLEIDKSDDIKEVLDKYRQSSGSPIKELAGDGRYHPTEEKLFLDIIKRIKKAWDTNEISTEEIAKILGDSVRSEKEENEFRAIASKEDASIDKNETKQIKTLLKERLSSLMQDKINPLTLIDFVNNNETRSIFVREFINTVMRRGGIKLKKEPETFLLVDGLLTEVINEINNI